MTCQNGFFSQNLGASQYILLWKFRLPSPPLGNLPQAIFPPDDGPTLELTQAGKPCVRANETPPSTFQRKAQLASSCQKLAQTAIPFKTRRSVGGWNHSGLHCKSPLLANACFEHLQQGLVFLGGEASGLFLGSNHGFPCLAYHRSAFSSS